MDRIYCAEQIHVPADFPALLKAYTKEVIRFNPTDIAAFSRDYFAALAQGSTCPPTAPPNSPSRSAAPSQPR